MKESFEQYINTHALTINRTVISRRIRLDTVTEAEQRIRIISELTELYYAYDLIGTDRLNSSLLELLESRQMDQFCRLYVASTKDTRASELADVVISCLTLMIILGQEKYSFSKQGKQDNVTFLRLISKCASGCQPAFIIDWCHLFAETHNIPLIDHIRLKLCFNLHRTDWPDRS